uniref:Uncharacterized protein n=1 Tax=uncultured marine thaumarchaeote SAT1000_10_G09 TaxID=1456375 RepID=A0A075I4N5_9ARCH|nr:hypothetical protein [uncultured marine thaumarchaeote SAT1000_10_G09]
MNNEIGRKLTSLTLMTIMLAGGMVIAAPSMVPEAAAAGQLYVSAENAQFGNLFGGGSVVEVIVKDPNRADTDVAEAEPTVYVDNNVLRLAQGVDGYWYAYIGAYGFIDDSGSDDFDSTDNYLDYGVQTADGLIGQDHLGLTGTGESDMSTGASFTMLSATTGVITNPPTLSDYNGTDNSHSHYANNTNADQSSVYGQIGVNSTEWPFIQLYDFTQGAFDIVLSQAGQDEVVTLDYDSSGLDGYASVVVDRLSATQGSEVHLEIFDQALNIDPTNEDIVIFYVPTDGSAGTVSFTNGTMPGEYDGGHEAENMGFGDNGVLKINYNANGAQTAAGVAVPVFANDATADDGTTDQYLVFYEGADNSGVFYNTDDSDDSNLIVSTTAMRGTTGTIDYNDSAVTFLVTNDFGDLDMDESSIGDEWNSGETLAVTLIDQDLNKNSWSSEDMALNSSYNSTVPSLQIGSPITLSSDSLFGNTESALVAHSGMTCGTFNKVCTLTSPVTALLMSSDYVQVSFNGTTIADARTAIEAATYVFVNYDVTETAGGVTGISLVDASGEALMTETATTEEVGLVQLAKSTVQVVTTTDLVETDTLILNFTSEGTSANTQLAGEVGDSIYVDIFTFGDRVNNAIYRLLLEESDDNSATFEGDVEFIMLNQINVDAVATFSGLSTYGSSLTMIVHEDMTDEDSPRINYMDLGADGVETQIADQVAAPSHSGVVTFDSANYKTADTVVVTLDDQDLNTDSGLLDVYITDRDDKVGNEGTDHILDITFNDVLWQNGADLGKTAGTPHDGLEASGFTLVETAVDSGIFTGSFQVPVDYYDSGSATTVTTTGTDIEVNYNDHRDASGETIEVGAGASVNANTGSVEFDRNVYPVPWGNETSGERFALHSTAAESTAWTDSHLATSHSLAQGNVTVHVSVTDADYDISAMGEDSITDTTVTLKIERGSATPVTVAVMGDSAANAIIETSPTSGVFEWDATVGYRSGPSLNCPTTFSDTCVLQGDILTVEYADLKDASGQAQTVTDSATFDLRNGVLQADKSVYLIGSDMILTLIEPDFDRDNDGAESYTLDLIEWDSDAATTTMGDYAGSGAQAAFDPEPSLLRETGDSTGIFQVVIEIPDTLVGELLDRGEQIDLEYTDWGPAGADYVGQEDESIGVTVYTSNFGATIELDQKVYTWTDLVYITIVAPDHNFDSGLVDEIGSSSGDPIKVSTRGNELNNYKLVESGADTGIFIGEVTLGGFIHDASGDGTNDITATASTLTTGSGPTDGVLATTDNDGLTVSFEFSEDETVVGSALIRWNIGEVQFLESSYPASGTGVIRIIDADMNLNPAAIDNFAVDAWSDSDAGGIDLTVTETNEATGIFEGTVFFTTVNDSSGHRLRVAEGDTVTAEYEDNTLPDPYTTADELDITATTLIGTVVPPLERAPAANLRIVDAFGNSLNAVSVDQQVQLTADLANGQDKEQSFAYLVQIQDGDGVTVSLAWITGSLSSGQSFSPALSWIPTEGGSYTATAFVWESVDNPTALSPPVSTTISVQ